MTENLKAFLDAVQNNEELKEKFDEISNKKQAEQKDYSGEYIALAKKCGITLTDEDFESAEQELSDEDLENVSGGVYANLAGTLQWKRWQEEHKAEIAKRRAQGESQSTAGTTAESQN